jgi:UDP-glucose 4-epimerase
MKVLVIGGAGFVGSVVVQQLCQAGHDVTVCDNLSTGNAWTVPPDARFVPSDLTDARSVGLVMRGGYDAVAHFGGLSNARASFRDPLRYLRTNFGGSLNLLTGLREYGINRLVYASSAAVYGDPGPKPVTETAAVAPATPYAYSVAAVEQAISYETMTSDLGAVTLRMFNVAGAYGSLGEWHHPETHLIPAALQVAAGVRDPLAIYGVDHDTADGTAVRDFVHVADAARACVLALEATTRPGHQVYNIGTGMGHSVLEVLRMARAVIRYPIPVDEIGAHDWEAPIVVASSERARHGLGWVPQRSDLRQIIEDAWTFLHGHLGCGADLGSAVIA